MLARLRCNLSFALHQRLISVALSICSRGEFYEPFGSFSLWRVVALAVDGRHQKALQQLLLLEEEATAADKGKTLQMPLQEVKRVLLRTQRE